MSNISVIVDEFLRIKRINPKSIKYSRYVKSAKQLLDYCNGDVGMAIGYIYEMKSHAEYYGFNWSIETIFKRWKNGKLI